MAGFGFSNAHAASPERLLPIQVIRDGAKRGLNFSTDQLIGNTDLKVSADAFSLASLWLNEATIFPASDLSGGAWSRRDWIDNSISNWQELIEPFAQGLAAAITQVFDQIQEESAAAGENPELGPEVAQAMRASLGLPEGFPLPNNFNLAAIKPFLQSFLGTMLASQLGMALAQMSDNIVSANDVGLPILNSPTPNLMPAGIKKFAEGLEVPISEIYLFLALREAASSRLFAHTPWLLEYLKTAIAAFGRGIQIDLDLMQRQAEDAMSQGELDFNNPDSLGKAISAGIFTPEQSLAQTEAKERLETILALIEGWVDQVVEQAAGERLPNYPALHEAYRRNRALGSPAAGLFKALVGLELSPKRTREASAFFKVIAVGNQPGIEHGVAARDHRFEDAALLPRANELTDPISFLQSTTVPDDLSGLI